MPANHIVNQELLKMAFQTTARSHTFPPLNLNDPDEYEKAAFVPAGGGAAGGGGMDPSGGAGGAAQGGMPPGGDPSGGGAPPAPGGDPSGGGGSDPNAIASAVASSLAPIMQGGMGSGMGGGGVEPIKPKIDVNVTMLQILKILAKIADTLGVQIPASEMVATSNDLTSFAQQQGPSGGAAGGGSSAIQPIQPMQGAGPGMGKTSNDRFNNGRAFDSAGMGALQSRASALLAVRSRHPRTK